MDSLDAVRKVQVFILEDTAEGICWARRLTSKDTSRIVFQGHGKAGLVDIFRLDFQKSKEFYGGERTYAKKTAFCASAKRKTQVLKPLVQADEFYY